MRLRMPFRVVAAVLITPCVMLVAGCGAKVTPYVPKSTEAPPIKYCNSATGHIPGSKPWIMGGTCCCTPTAGLVEQYQRDGFCESVTLDDLIAMYRDADVITDLDIVGTNNLDDHGPHVVKGGKSMVTPTPGTRNFEEVVSGVFD